MTHLQLEKVKAEAGGVCLYINFFISAFLPESLPIAFWLRCYFFLRSQLFAAFTAVQIHNQICYFLKATYQNCILNNMYREHFVIVSSKHVSFTEHVIVL